MTRILVATLLAGLTLQAQDRPGGPDPWFGTFSIIAVDPATREFGVGVQSRAFGAGAAVPYAVPGVGAIATQASANRHYGPKAIALLQQGLSPAEVVKRITDEDPGRDTRQVAVIDAQGRSAVYTGKRVIDRNHDPKDLVHLGGYAGHVTGVNYSVQGNTLASEAVVKAMAAAYEGGKGSMAERLMDALDAGQRAGGDTRGMQSAGILVVRPIPAGSDATVERVVDIRVDDHEQPFVELRRLLDMTLGVPARLITHATELAKSGRHAEAIAEMHKALAINPRSEPAIYALAQRYAQAGDTAKALEQLALAIRRQPVQWKAQAAADPIFAPLKASPAFQRLIAPTAEAPFTAQTGSVTLRAPLMLDGRGGSRPDVTVTVSGGRITAVGTASGPATYDLSGLTLLPGFIDTHVHIGWHFDANDRYATGPEPADQAVLYAAENAWVTMMAGFTTVQSVGAASDKALRTAIARGVLPGPRLLSSLGQIANPKLTPDEMRAAVRQFKSDGADLVKIFASASIRDGGVPTLSQAQLDAACGEAKTQGLRSMVHAHAPEAMMRAARAGCTVVEHGGLANAEALALLAEKGVWFDPNIGLVTQNYLENRTKFLGIGNYTNEGFASMEKALGFKDAMFSAALATTGLKMVMGTDAVAGAHGQNMREVLERVKSGQAPAEAIKSLTSLAAASMNLEQELGAIAIGLQADLVAVDGNPLTDITALQRVRFVMRGGRVYKNERR